MNARRAGLPRPALRLPAGVPGAVRRRDAAGVPRSASRRGRARARRPSRASSSAPSPTSLVNATALRVHASRPPERENSDELAVARARRPLRAADVRAQSRLHAARRVGPGARDRRQHGDLHDRQRRAAQAAAVCGAGPAGDAVEHERDRASRSRGRLAARLPGLQEGRRLRRRPGGVQLPQHRDADEQLRRRAPGRGQRRLARHVRDARPRADPRPHVHVGRRAELAAHQLPVLDVDARLRPERRRAHPQHPGPAVDRARRHAERLRVPLQDDARDRTASPGPATSTRGCRCSSSTPTPRARPAARISSAACGCSRSSRASSRASRSRRRTRKSPGSRRSCRPSTPTPTARSAPRSSRSTIRPSAGCVRRCCWCSAASAWSC